MITARYSNPTLAQNLTRLAELCKAAGATASTVIHSSNNVVVFYKDPQLIGIQQHDDFDELHIHHQKDACLLIAVFPNDGV